MLKKTVTKRGSIVASVLALSLAMTACSSSDDDDDTSTEGTTETDGTEGTEGGDTMLNPNLQQFDFSLDSASTVPAANVEGASGSASFSVDTATGSINGTTTVTGTSGMPSAAHIHSGAPGQTGPIVVILEGNEDGTVWSTPEGATLDAAGIEAFNAGNLYVNVHTDANPDGELRGQLADGNLPSAGSYTISFRNLSTTQPMTPPVVALHNAPDADNGIRLFESGQPASAEIIQVAEDGNIQPLVDVANGQIQTGRVSAAGVAFPDPENPGPLTPGATSSITLMPELPNQVLTVVSMVVCTNDGFSGIDSRPLSDAASETFTAAIYDAGSETNVLTLDYWVPPCSADGASPNIGDEENGSIVIHPGQEGSENPDFDFPAGSELLEITVTLNQ